MGNCCFFAKKADVYILDSSKLRQVNYGYGAGYGSSYGGAATNQANDENLGFLLGHANIGFNAKANVVNSSIKSCYETITNETVDIAIKTCEWTDEAVSMVFGAAPIATPAQTLNRRIYRSITKNDVINFDGKITSFVASVQPGGVALVSNIDYELNKSGVVLFLKDIYVPAGSWIDFLVTISESKKIRTDEFKRKPINLVIHGYDDFRNKNFKLTAYNFIAMSPNLSFDFPSEDTLNLLIEGKCLKEKVDDQQYYISWS